MIHHWCNILSGKQLFSQIHPELGSPGIGFNAPRRNLLCSMSFKRLWCARRLSVENGMILIGICIAYNSKNKGSYALLRMTYKRKEVRIEMTDEWELDHRNVAFVVTDVKLYWTIFERHEGKVLALKYIFTSKVLITTLSYDDVSSFYCLIAKDFDTKTLRKWVSISFCSFLCFCMCHTCTTSNSNIKKYYTETIFSLVRYGRKPITFL